MGAACSQASSAAAQVLAASGRIPLISPVSSSPELSNGLEYPSFLRTAASQELNSECMVDILKYLFNYSQVVVIAEASTCMLIRSSLPQIPAGVRLETDVAQHSCVQMETGYPALSICMQRALAFLWWRLHVSM